MVLRIFKVFHKVFIAMATVGDIRCLGRKREFYRLKLAIKLRIINAIALQNDAVGLDHCRH